MLEEVEGSGAKWWICGPLRLETPRMYLCGEMRSQLLLVNLPGRWGRELVWRAAGDSDGG